MVRRAAGPLLQGRFGGALAVALMGLAAPAWAQDPIRFDATGPDVPPLTAHGPVTLWSADGMRKGEIRLGGLGEAAGGLLQLGAADRSGISDDKISLATGLNLSGAWAPNDIFGIGATASLWALAPEGQVGVGVLRLDAPVRIVRSDDDLAVAVHPWIGLPIGGAQNGVASPQLSGGLMAAARIPAGPVEANANLGLSGRPSGDFPDFGNYQLTQTIGGPSVDFGAAVGVRPGDVEVDLELRGAWSVAAGAQQGFEDVVPDSNVFAELGLTTGLPVSDALRVRGGVAAGLSTGIGTSVARGFLGLTWRDRPATTPEIVDADPQPGDIWTLTVTGDGAPLVGAIVLVDGNEAGRTGVDGSVELEDISWKAGVAAEAPGFRRATFDKPSRGVFTASVDLEPYAQPVALQIQSAGGESLEATVTATAEGQAPVTGTLGNLSLPPGRWTLEIVNDGYGTQVRKLDVVAGVPPEPVEVVLQESQGEAAMVHTVLDAEGAPVSGATVLLDGLPIGTTGEDGTIEIAGLAEGDHTLSVQHPSYTATEQPVSLSAGKIDLETPLARVPGTVKVIARNGKGDPVSDAVVRFAGPRRLAPMPLGTRGERTEVLGPGAWQLLISSVQYGFQQREVVVPERSWDLIEVSVVLQPTEGGQARLEVRVVDPDGTPIDNARVSIDGQDFGTTSTGGALVLEGLNAGQRELQVASEYHREQDPVPVVLVDGLQEELVNLPWKAGTVRVTARTPNGVITDAKARFAGPDPIDPTELGQTGTAYFQVAPGDWSVLVTSPTHGIQQRQFAVAEDARSLHDVTVVLNATEGGLANLSLAVSDPDGAAVDGAAVYLDGIPLGNTSGGTLRAEQLSTGKQLLEIESPYFQEFSESVQLMEGDLERDVTLQWAAGLVKVRMIDGNGRPVTDGVVRLLGARSIPPSPVNADGERLFALEPGDWQALAISPTLGMTQVPVLVTPEADGLQVVVAEMRKIEAGLADMVLRIVDGVGRPVPNAEIMVDGQSRGTTAAGGVVVLRNLVPGEARVEVEAPKHTAAAVSVEVAEGSQVRYVTLDALPGRLEVTVTDTDGKPVDAEVSLIGPEDWMPTNTGKDGVEEFMVAPGAWQVIARADGLAAGRADAVVTADGDAAVSLSLKKSQVDVGDEEVVIRDVVLFDFNAATLRPEAGPLLDEVANTLVSNTTIIRVEVQGHSDNIGNLAYNRKLSQRRAESVRAALVKRGVAPEKLTARGYGAQRPVATNETEEGRSANRRVEFEILE